MRAMLVLLVLPIVLAVSIHDEVLPVDARRWACYQGFIQQGSETFEDREPSPTPDGMDALRACPAFATFCHASALPSKRPIAQARHPQTLVVCARLTASCSRASANGVQPGSTPGVVETMASRSA